VADRHRAYHASAAEDGGNAGRRPCDAAGLAHRIDEHALEHLHILVIDDDETICEALAEALEQYGAYVACAPSAAAALERLTRERFDIACSDLEMTGGSGLSLARAVRAGEDEGQRLPLIAVTGLFGKELEASIRQAGFDAYVPKPVDVELLARRVRSLVDKS